MKKTLLSLICLVLSSCMNNRTEQTSVPEIKEKSVQESKIINVQVIKRDSEETKIKFIRPKATAYEVLGIMSAEQQNAFKESDIDISPEANLPVNQYDAVAKLIAGLHMPEDFSDKNAFETYRNHLNSDWSNLGNKSLFMVKKWAEAYVHPLISKTSMVFYPFGGPDVAYVSKFFPNATDYILVGLEKIGDFQTIQQKIKDPLYLENLKDAFATYLDRGFFITSEMMSKTSQGTSTVGGTLCFMLIQLARLGYDIISVEDVSINEKGEIVPRASNMINGVKIACSEKSFARQKNFYYFRADMGNKTAHLDNLKNYVGKYVFTTFLKSASYALADKNLSGMKNFILDNSLAILQDDSGVPFASFDKRWDKYAFGVYTKPILKIFSYCVQPDLAEFFKNSEFIPIAFKIGYGFSAAKPNLLLAVNSEKHKAISGVAKAKNKNDADCENCDNSGIGANKLNNMEKALKTVMTSIGYNQQKENE